MASRISPVSAISCRPTQLASPALRSPSARPPPARNGCQDHNSGRPQPVWRTCRPDRTALCPRGSPLAAVLRLFFAPPGALPPLLRDHPLRQRARRCSAGAGAASWAAGPSRRCWRTTRPRSEVRMRSGGIEPNDNCRLRASPTRDIWADPWSLPPDRALTQTWQPLSVSSRGGGRPAGVRELRPNQPVRPPHGAYPMQPPSAPSALIYLRVRRGHAACPFALRLTPVGRATRCRAYDKYGSAMYSLSWHGVHLLARWAALTHGFELAPHAVVMRARPVRLAPAVCCGACAFFTFFVSFVNPRRTGTKPGAGRSSL
eukprot:SAG11_NODE_1406_length_5001_cov_3.996124_4_plen_316_part_00